MDLQLAELKKINEELESSIISYKQQVVDLQNAKAKALNEADAAHLKELRELQEKVGSLQEQLVEERLKK